MSNEGKQLLWEFRLAQRARGNDGCNCNECQEDMQIAYDNLIKHKHRED